MNNWIKKFLLCLYIYINKKIKIKQAALSRLKLPVRFPARNDSNGRGLSICLQCGLFAFRIRKGFAYLILIQKALLNYSSTASVSSTTECRSPRNPFFFKSSLFSSSPFFHSSFSSTCHCLEICLAPLIIGASIPCLCSHCCWKSSLFFKLSEIPKMESQ